MYILLFLLSLSALSASPQCQRGHWPWVSGWRDRVRAEASHIARSIVEADRSIRNFCQSHSRYHMMESYGIEYYKLDISLGYNYQEADISVKIIHKLVLVSIVGCSSYGDVRILPDVVDRRRGKWTLSDGKLTVFFPYIMRPENDMIKHCDQDIIMDPVVVPKCEETIDFGDDITLRFGDVAMKNSFRNFLMSGHHETQTGDRSLNDISFH